MTNLDSILKSRNTALPTKVHIMKPMVLPVVTYGCESWTTLLLLLLLLSRFSRVQLCATPETATHQAAPSLGFSRQEHWSGLPFPSPRLTYFSNTYYSGALVNPLHSHLWKIGSPSFHFYTLVSKLQFCVCAVFIKFV